MTPLARIAAVVAAATLVTCSRGPATPPTPGTASVWFVDRSAELGLDFVHFNGMSGELYFPEIFGSGAALFDYDGDGDLDVYLVQGAMLGPGKTLADAKLSPPAPPKDRLFRNEIVESGRLSFTDVTARSGLDEDGYGMGVAAGDYDGDGALDLYVTRLGPNALLRGRGDGTFEDVTARAGVAEERWSTSAAFVDYDLDGKLDLFVANYVGFSFSTHRPCLAATGAPEYCGPQSYRPLPDRLFRNRGDGTFEDVTARSQIARHFGAGLGVIDDDFDGDGLVDLYVANDGLPNLLWINRGDGTFEEGALLAGCAFNQDGKAEASMGIDAGDFDGDGDPDLFVTHLDSETNTLYVNDGGWFRDRTLATGLGPPSRAFTGFGAAWIDIDLDGWLDLVVANGAVKQLESLVRVGDPFPLHQTNQIFHNQGGRGFREVTTSSGPALSLSEVSRGAAFGDVDNDGDPDVLIANNSGPARLLVNESPGEHAWVGLRLTDADGRRDLLGTRVAVRFEDGDEIWRRSRAAASYLSSNDPRVLVGLTGRDAPVREIRVHWPDGSIEAWEGTPVGRYTTLRQGSGQPAEPAGRAPR